MDYSIWDLLKVIGALGVFIYGMKIMSEALQKIAGNSMRRILEGMTKNHFFGILTGLIVTVLIQSSSATTVMVVSFVNAGLLQLTEAIGVVMGANIGTTVTAWLLSSFGFGKVSMELVSFIAIAFTFPLLFSSNNKVKNSGEFTMGFGLLFIGLNFLKQNVPDLKHNPDILAFIQEWTEYGFGSLVLFVLLGMVLTIIIQSSSATTALTLIMVTKGYISFEHATAMVLGENIGTTITANIAASIANNNAKRIARFHSLFNIIGVVWMLLLIKVFNNLVVQILPNIPFINVNEGLVHMALHDSTQIETAKINLSGEELSSFNAEIEKIRSFATATFHTLFNVTNVFLLFWFTKPLSKLIIRLQRPKDDEEEESGLKYIETGIFDTPELSIMQARKEMENMSKVVAKMIVLLNVAFFEKPKRFNQIIEKIKDREILTDKFEIEISNYLTLCAAGDISEEASIRIRTMLKCVDDMETVADIITKSAVIVQSMKESKINIPTETEVELKNMVEQLHNHIKNMTKAISQFPEVDRNLIMDSFEIEESMRDYREKFKEDHYLRMENGIYSINDGIFYHDLMINMKRAGGHVTNVMEALDNQKF